MSDIGPYTPRFTAASDGAAVGSTTVRVDDPERLDVHDIALVTGTGELFQVEKAVEGTLTVRRGLGGEPHPIRKGDEILRVGSALETP